MADHQYNYVRNGGLWFAQRQAPATLTTYSATAGRAISADGWGITNENASAQYQRTDTIGAIETGLQAQFYGNFTKITSTGKLIVSQVIEAREIAAIRGKLVRLQVNLKRIVADATIRLGLIQLNSSGTVDAIPATFISAFGANGTDPTLGTNLAYIAPTAPADGTISGNAISCSVVTAWQRFGGLFLVPTNCKNLVVMLWSNSQLAATNGFAMTEALLVDASQPQEDYNPYNTTEELQRCQRFYSKTFSVDTAPATAVGADTGEAKNIAGKAGAVAIAGVIPWRYPVPMRAAPTVTLYNPAAANALIRDYTTGADMGATAATVGTGDSGMVVIATGVAATAVGDHIGIHISADAEL